MLTEVTYDVDKKQYFSVNSKYTVRYWAKSTVIVFYFDYCYILRIVFAKLKSRFKVITMVTMMAYFFVAKHAYAIKETKWKFTLSTILWLEQFGKCDRLKGIVSRNWRGLQMILLDKLKVFYYFCVNFFLSAFLYKTF